MKTKQKLDGTQVRDWLRNFFASEKELVDKYLARGNASKARDCMVKDIAIAAIMTKQGLPMTRGTMGYHRKVVLDIPGQLQRFNQYQTEWAEANGNKTPAK